MEGHASISADVLSRYAANPARGVPGVRSLVDQALPYRRGVKVDTESELVNVELRLAVEWGVSIPAVGRESSNGFASTSSGWRMSTPGRSTSWWTSRASLSPMLSVRRGTASPPCSMLCRNDMRIALDNTAALGELLGFLRSFDCSAQAVGPDVVEVEFKRASRTETRRPNTGWT